MAIYGISVEPVADPDLANIFVYVPRQVPFEFLIFAISVFVILLGMILYQRGGAIQNIVDTKTG